MNKDGQGFTGIQVTLVIIGALFMAFLWLLVMYTCSCTFEVKNVEVPPPNIYIHCFYVELPGGYTTISCPDGGSDSGDAE